jgi:hypothetical protein
MGSKKLALTMIFFRSNGVIYGNAYIGVTKRDTTELSYELRNSISNRLNYLD